MCIRDGQYRGGRVGLCARAGACGPEARRHPPSLKSPNAILELSDANFAGIFGVILMFLDQGFLSQNYSPSSFMIMISSFSFSSLLEMVSVYDVLNLCWVYFEWIPTEDVVLKMRE